MKKNATSTPVKWTTGEGELDKQLEELEKSITDTENKLQEIEHWKRLKEKKDKLEILHKQLRRNERKNKKEEEDGEIPDKLRIKL